MLIRWCAVLVLLMHGGHILASDARIIVEHAHEHGVYAIGEEIRWTVSVEHVQAEDAARAYYTLHAHGKTLLRKQAIDLSAQSQVITYQMDKPGSVLLSIYVPRKGHKKPMRDRCGALVAPDRIQPSMPKPLDFDEFWQAQLKRQQAVPMQAVLEAEQSSDDLVDSWLLRMDTVDGQGIRGRLAKPSKPGTYPAMVIFQWAGVYGLDPKWAVEPARSGWLVLNISAHDIPINKDKEFYQQLKNGALKNYAHIGSEDREQSYFLRMNLACARAVDYVSEHPSWNGQHVVVTGNSQGGYQSIVAAGLNPKVTAIMTRVPAGCDHSAAEVGRAIGWPRWMLGDEGNQKKLQTARYYDAVNFAYHINCPILLGYGMGDTSSRVEGIEAALSVMQGPVIKDRCPDGEHGTAYPRYEQLRKQWLHRMKMGLEPIEE